MYIHQKWRHWRTRTRALLVLVGILAPIAAYPLLAETGAPARRVAVRALAVAVVEAKLVSAYEVSRSYVGRVESARRSELALEIAGLVRRIDPEEGDTVLAGQVIAVLDTARLRARREAIAAARDAARADLELSQLIAARHESLVREDVISHQVWDETRKQREARAAELQRLESEIAIIDVDLEKSLLRAPYSGEIARRYVDEGSVLAAGEPVARLLETTRMEVRVGVAAADAHTIAIGSEQVVRVAGRSLHAEVRSVLPERGPETRAVDVILALAHETRGLRDGDLAELSLRSSVTANGVWLPMSALREGARGLWSCFVVEALPEHERSQAVTHRLGRRHLEVLHEESDRVFVRGTLRSGERVVVGDTQRLVVGQSVRIAGEEV